MSRSSSKGSVPRTPRSSLGKRDISSPQPTSQNVRVNVCVRVRPLNALEKRTKQVDAWSYGNDEIFQTYIPWDKDKESKRKSKKKEAMNFRFDKIFLPEENNEDIHDYVGTKVVDFVMKGYHGCLFAYGQTSAGKTHTIHGAKQDPGLIPRSISLIFKYIEDQPDREFVLRVSFFEIYNEIVNDLLAPQSVNLRIREDRKKGVFVQGLKEEVVMGSEQVLALISMGQSHRHVGRTNYNEASSRSHTVFRLVVESAEKKENARSRRSCLNIVDLAGSENAVKAGQSRIKETGYINKSLLTLGHVIMKLSEKRKNSHIPYRNSKLTRILQSSLSGQAAVAIVCCISPSSKNLEETISTLKFASRAKKIKASVKVNYDEQTLLKQYRGEIERLKKEVAELRARAEKEQPGGGESKDGESSDNNSAGDEPSRPKSRDGDTPSDKQSEIREKKARIDQLMRVILKSSKATMPKEMNQVICEKLQKGQISLDEFTHIRRVIAASQKTEDLPSGMRRPSGIRRPTSRASETKTFVKRSTSFADKFSAAQNSKKKMLANSNVEEMLETLKEVSEAQAIEISRLNKENEELRRMNAEKDEALNEWDMYYQNEQNKPTHDTDQLAAQLLAMETKMETDTAKHQSEVARLQEEIERLKSGRLGSSTSTTTTTTTTTAQIAKGSGESDGEQLLPAPFRLFD